MGGLTRRELIRAGASTALGLYVPIRLLDRGQPPRRANGSPHARVADNALEELARRLRGELLLRQDPRYGNASQPANTRFDAVRPLAVAACIDEHDVATCVNWCGENGIQGVARTGGHSYAGFSTTTGLLIDMAALDGVVVDKNGRAEIGGGAVNHDVFQRTEGGPFILPGGTCPAVGVSGLTLGGGIGYNTHWAGLTCDHLLGSRVVTASGELLHVDGSNHSDLLWACRGGAGGSFGINTSLTFQLAKIPRPEVAFYRFDYRGADAAGKVLMAFDTMLQNAPRELNAVAMAQATKVGAGGPREAIATFSRGQYLGPLEELVELVKPLLHAAQPREVSLKTLPYWEMQQQFLTEATAPHAWGDHSLYSRAPLPEEVMAKVVELLVECPSRDEHNNGSFWSLGWVGGKANEVDRRATAYVHRDALTLLRATSVWEANAPQSVGENMVAWTEAVIRTIAPYTSGESYQNFPNLAIGDWQSEYYGENFNRLVDVKTKYDPGNFFHNAQSIPTLGA